MGVKRVKTEGNIEMFRISLDASHLPTVKAFKAALVASGLSEEEWMLTGMNDFLASLDGKGVGTLINTTDLIAYAKEHLKLDISQDLLRKWRQFQWTEGKEYFRKVTEGRNEIAYDLEKVLPLLRVRKKKVVKQEKARLAESAEAEPEEGPKVREYGEWYK